MSTKRRKIGVALPADDMDVINKTLSESGVMQTTKTPPATKMTDSSQTKASNGSKNQVQPATLTSQDLRCYIAPSSALAAALAADLEQVDPRMRKLVQPTTVLRKFLAEHDDKLAKLFKQANELKELQ